MRRDDPKMLTNVGSPEMDANIRERARCDRARAHGASGQVDVRIWTVNRRAMAPRHTRLLALFALCGALSCSNGDGSERDANVPRDATSSDDGTPDAANEDVAMADATVDGFDAVVDSSSGSGVRALVWTFDREPLGAGRTGGTLAEGGSLDGSISFAEGQLRGAVSAVGGNGTVLVSPAAALDFDASTSFRIEATFRTAHHGRDGASGRGTLVARGRAGSPGFALRVENGLLTLDVADGSRTARVQSRTRVDDDRFHQATALVDRARGAISIVVDGFDVATVSATIGSVASSAPLELLGAGGAEHFFGMLDAIAVRPGRVHLPTATAEWVDERVFDPATDTASGTTYTAFRIPSIVTLDNGTVLAFAEARVDEECDFGRIHVVMKRSDDHGETWSSLLRVATFGTGKVGNPVAIADGNRVVLMTLEVPCTTGSGCDCAGEQIIRVRTSDDGGRTWSTARDVTSTTSRPGWGGMLLGPGSGIRLRGAAHAGALVVPAKHGSDSHLLVSEDHGATWTIAAEDASPVTVNESTAAELSDGRILVDARVQRSLDAEDSERALGFRTAGHVSPTTWRYSDSPTFVREAGFHGSVVHAALLSHRGLRVEAGEEPLASDLSRIVFSYPAGEHGSTGTRRRRDLRVYNSRNDGLAWGRGRRLTAGFAAYSSLTSLADGRLAVLYEGGSHVASSPVFYGPLRVARFRPEWVDHSELLTYGFEGLALGAHPTRVDSSGAPAVPLSVEGTLTVVEGPHHSTAAQFDGATAACSAGTRGDYVDFGRRDSFVVEASFRTSSHASGGSTASGSLVTRTAVGSSPAFWLRIEDGAVRFLFSECESTRSDCGIIAGACGALSACVEHDVRSRAGFSDGAWHDVRVVRDAQAATLVLVVDGVEVDRTSAPATGIVTNEEPLCLGAFSGGTRAFNGQLASVRLAFQ